jgi:hypothetical protein
MTPDKCFDLELWKQFHFYYLNVLAKNEMILVSQCLSKRQYL